MQTTPQMSQTRPSDATGSMSIMGSMGDTKCYWNADRPEEVEAAREIFMRHQGNGYRAFSMTRDGTQGEQMTDFDPAAESILFLPQMQGG